MKLFSLGPTEMFPNTLDIASRQIAYFRTPEFSEIMFESSKLLKKLTNAPLTSEVVFLAASGTGAMESVVINCFDKNDKLLVINGGTFGKRFVEICNHHAIPCEVLEVPLESDLTSDMLDSYDNTGLTGLLVNIHETSICKLYDVNLLADFCNRNNLLFIVDAISSFLADSLDIAKIGADACILSSQKGLALSPGLSMVILSENIISNRINRIESPTIYFNFKTYLADSIRGQTPFTPAVGIILELNDRLRGIESNSGAAGEIWRSERLAASFRNQLAGNDAFSIPSYKLSSAGTLVLLNGVSAIDLNRWLINKYQIFINPCGGQLADKAFRVAHIGNLIEKDFEILVSILREGVRKNEDTGF
jgi:aspartate aminotransferase-like enzyme